ncbi:hypothetical protein [Thalassotalea sediminis]|uniref:hypothetical protein n=1 Tax=Thalassotalea sediminis TaxID=1759089 RepID=UPI0025724141|nr:hypothetical protein [Thalassotalea sediminis]
MPVNIQKDSHLLNVVIDLMAYYKLGDLSLFHQLCSKVLLFLNTSYSVEQEKKFRRLVLSRLTAFGIVEISAENSLRKWRLINNGFIEIDSNSFLVIGNISFREQVISSLENCELLTQLDQHKLYEFPKEFGVGIVLTLVKINISAAILKRIASKLNSSIFWLEQRTLDLLLPPLSSVKSKLSIENCFDGVTQYSTYKKFDFETCKWININGSLIEEEGYYQLPHLYGNYRNICIRKEMGVMVTYDMNSRNWTYLLALSVMHQKIYWRYKSKVNKLYIPSQQFGLLPTLFKRAMLTKSFKWPKHENGYYVVTKISSDDVELILERYSIIRISYEF